MRSLKKSLSNFEKTIQWFFRFLIIAIIICYAVFVVVLPAESDAFFERGSQAADTESFSDEDSILYNGEFKLLDKSGDLIPLRLPCRVEAEADDVVTVVSTIPDNYDKDYIIIRSSLQNVSIYVDGELRVEYDTANSRPFGSQTASRYVFCKTSSDDAGKELKITLCANNVYCAGQIETVYSCNKYTFWMFIFNKYGMMAVFSFVAICCGLFIILIGLCMTIKLKFGSGIENVGWCVFMIGMWLLCESRIIELIVPNNSAFINLGFLVIMTCPIPLLLFFDEAQLGRYRKIYRGLICVAVINVIVLNILQLLNIADYLDTLPISHVMLGASFVTVFVTMILDIKNHHIKENIRMFIGFSVLMVAVGIEIISVYLNALTGTFLIAGALIFAFCSVVNTLYLFGELKKKRQEQKMESLDYLTGLLLRNKGEKLIQKEMAENAGAFMFFDMDNLKMINDTYGHKYGDSALKAISEAICKNAGNNIVCRIGGDEFLAFLSGYDTQQAKEAVKAIISDFNGMKNGISNISKASLSAGICMTDIGDSFEAAKGKADKALYYVKQSGKDGFYFYRELINDTEANNPDVDLEHLVTAIKTAGGYTGSLSIQYREFTKFYDYLAKICERYKHTCHLALITLDADADTDMADYDIENAMESMGAAIKDNIRNVDICTRYSAVQFLIILLEAGDSNIDTIMQRIFAQFHTICIDSGYMPRYKSCMMKE